MADANPAAAATDAAKAGATKALGALTKVATQLIHPKNWIRNAGIAALACVFLPAATAVGTTGSLGALFSHAAGTATSSIGAAAASIPNATGFVSSHVISGVETAKGLIAGAAAGAPHI